MPVSYTHLHGIYDFVPYDHKITTPYLYGLDSFEMQELAELKKPYMEKTIRYSCLLYTSPLTIHTHEIHIGKNGLVQHFGREYIRKHLFSDVLAKMCIRDRCRTDYY